MQGTEKIISTRYDAAAEQLVVTFESGRSFVFTGVPAVNAQLLSIEADPMTYFDGWIRGHFEWNELETPATTQFIDLVAPT